MCTQLRRVGLLGLVVAGLWLTGVARADVSTERSGSILVFPKIISNSTRDTIIQITNTSNSLVRAHCFYVNAALKDPTQPQSALNTPLWQEIDFDIVLTKQQPTHWVVGPGRRVNPFDDLCSGPPNIVTDCNDAGYDPGLVPPTVPDFMGELKCIEVDDSGAPLSGNHLKGEATLVDEESGDISKYNGVAILGNENNGDGTLVLGAGQCVGNGGLLGAICKSDDDCGDAAPCAPEYNACPQTWIVNHQADGAPDLALAAAGETSSSVTTELTVVPCTENFETQAPTSVTLQFDTTNEFESHFSVSTTVTCWGNFRLSDLGAPALTIGGTQVLDPQGTMFLQSRIRSAAGTPFGILMVQEEFHTDDSGDTAAAAVNPHFEGARQNPDVITIPADQLLP